MRARLAILPVLLVAVVALTPVTAVASSGHRVYLSQAGSGDEQTDQKGQGDPETEVGADKSQAEEGTTETGPLWTYQMARMSLALLLVALLAAGYWYYRFVVKRARGEI